MPEEIEIKNSGYRLAVAIFKACEIVHEDYMYSLQAILAMVVENNKARNNVV